jgi:formate--tetrahydrofolate ligase
MKSLEIAQKAKPIQIFEMAHRAGLRLEEIESFGNYKAKVSLSVLQRFAARPFGKLICVTGMTPTKEGDGKTSTSIGLTQALGLMKKKVMLCLREPSLAPIFGFKGGATGGGYSQVLPMADINLHFTGDIHAVEIAHNLLAAVVENHMHHGNALGIDKDHILWRRSMDISDRQLRDVTVGLAKASKFAKHRTGFDVTAASEVMACLSLATSVHHFKQKLAKISVALSQEGKLVTAKDLKASGAMALLMKDALKPNLVQTLEGQPVFMHTGPFANVSHGNNSLISNIMALKLANYVVTESGFATELGMEKLFDIVLRDTDIKPSVVVIVVSIKALKSHAGENIAMKKLGDVFKEGFENLERHVRNVRAFGVEPVIALNRFPQDTDDEIRTVKDFCQTMQWEFAVSEVVKLGGEGGLALAEKVLKVISEKPAKFKPLYDLSLSTDEKIHKLATDLYGASGVVYSDQAKQDLDMIHGLKLEHLPVCVAKTPYSFSDNSHLKGAPSDWKLKIGGLRPYTGAGFVVALAGKMNLMPGLPDKPMLENMDITDEGEPKGLF